jgi:hypothetical protein
MHYLDIKKAEQDMLGHIVSGVVVLPLTPVSNQRCGGYATFACSEARTFWFTVASTAWMDAETISLSMATPL